MARHTLATQTLTASVALMLFTGTQAQSQFSIESDPTTFALDGYALHVRYYPHSERPYSNGPSSADPSTTASRQNGFRSELSHWRFGAGAYSMELPDLIVDLESANRDEGWNVDLTEGFGLFAERYFNSERNGWFVGLQAAHHRYDVTNNNAGYPDTGYEAMIYMPYAGYLHEFDDHWYLQGWAGAGLSEPISGSDTSTPDDEYEAPRLLPLVTFHLGYRF